MTIDFILFITLLLINISTSKIAKHWQQKDPTMFMYVIGPRLQIAGLALWVIASAHWSWYGIGYMLLICTITFLFNWKHVASAIRARAQQTNSSR